jgi:protocatechuate 3,4-dioxygenase beta subunit
MSPTEKVNEADHLVCRCRRRSFVLVVESGEAQAQDLISSRTVLGAVISINSLRVLMTSRLKPTRRRFLLNTGMLAAGFELSCTDAVLTRELAPTPSCRDGDEPTIRQTEGPFFKPRSPERSELREPGTGGRQFELSGFVLTRSCRLLRGAVVDLWHADEKGEYDNIGFRYRGHVVTGPDGAFRFRTIVPAIYAGRTRHYHVKVQAPNSRLLTTQLYFPNEPANRRDGLFQRELLMQIADTGDGLDGRFDFILNIG